MSIFATLKFGNNDSGRYTHGYPVLAVRSHFMREVNGVRPSSTHRCESISLTLPTPAKDDVGLYEWFVEGSSRSGVIEIAETDAMGAESAVRTIKFENARCFGLREHYDNTNLTETLQFDIDFVAEQVSAGGVEFDLY